MMLRPMLLLLLLAPMGSAVAAEPTCDDAPVTLDRQGKALEIIHVVKGTDGFSHAKREPVAGTETTYLGLVLTQFGLGDPSNVVIVSAPPNMNIPLHAAPYREIFLVVKGSSRLILSDGTSLEQKPGTVTLMEDLTGPGHGGSSGPCGYTAVDLQFKP